jgi:IS5 family transposase
VERIGKSKAAAPCEFGAKVPIVINNRRGPGGTLGRCPITLTTVTPCDVIDRAERLTRCPIERSMSTEGTEATTCEMPVAYSSPARSAVSSVSAIASWARRSANARSWDTCKAEGHLGRCYLKGRAGDAANVVLSAIGHNFSRIIAWLRELCACSWSSYGARSPTDPAYSGLSYNGDDRSFPGGSNCIKTIFGFG